MSSRKNILIIYTGGTIGMVKDKGGYRPQKGHLAQLMEKISDLKDPQIPRYEIIEFEPIIDSSNVTPAVWNNIVQIIEEQYERYDGFLVIHGTDTMAYTASALAFMCQNLSKNIIITGSQIPLCEIRNDARENIITALLLCANYPTNEVSIYFNGKLLRGCRTTKTNVSGFDAFYSPNHLPLGVVGAKFNIKTGAISPDFDLSRKENNPIHLDKITFTHIDHEHIKLVIISLFPGLDPGIIEHVLELKINGIIIRAYGAGNGPSTDHDPRLINAIKSIVDKGVLVAVTTQCTKGSVLFGEYATSLRNAGAVSAFDMTVEASIAKMYYLLSFKDKSNIRQLFETNLSGELSKDNY